MTMSTREEIEKKAFRAGYECSCISVLAVPSSPEDLERYKLKVNYLVRDIYIFLMNHNQTKEDVFGEYMTQIADCRFDADTPASFYQQLPDVVGNAFTRVFVSAPEIAHAYFLSRICHFFLFGIRLNLTALTSAISSSFDNLFSLHERYQCWPYPLEMREALYTIYESFAANIWPSNMIIRHLYACLAELYTIEADDLLTTVGSDLRALDAFYPYIFPEEGKEGRPDKIVFDDTIAYFEYLKAANPALLSKWVDHASHETALLRRGQPPKSLQVGDQLPNLVRKYKQLPNLEKLKYVNLANSATSEEVDAVKIWIAPLFESDIFMRMATDKGLEEGLLDAHRY